MSQADISAGAAFVRIFVKTSELAHGLVTAENLVKGFTKRLPAIGHIIAEFTPTNIVRNITGVFTRIGDAVAKMMDRIGESLQSIGKKTAMAGVGIGAAMLAAAAHFGHAGDALWVLSQRTGASTQLLSGLGFAARQTGATIDEVETGIRMMQKTIGDAANGSTAAQAALGKLGLTVGDLIGKSPDEQFQMISDGLAGIKDQSLRTSAAVDVLGRSGQSLLPMMTGLRGFMADAGRLGLIVKPEQAQLAEQLVDKFQAMKEAVFAGVFAVGEALGPALLDAIKAASDLAIRFRAWVVDNKETVQIIAKMVTGVTSVGMAAVIIGATFQGVGAVIGAATLALGAFGSAVAVVAGVLSAVGIVLAIVAKFAAVSAFVSALAAAPVATFTAAITSAGAAIAAALGLVGSFLSTIFFHIILPAVAIVAGITAAIAAMAAGAVVAAVVFWKVAEPLKALKPVAMAAFEAIKNIGKAFSEGGIQSAANAAIDGLKRVFLQGANAIVVMIKNTMANLPGFIRSAVSGIGGATSAITATIQRLFTEMWPAVKVAWDAFASFAGDVLNQLPAFAGYAIGRLNRAMFDGFIALQKWIIETFLNVSVTLLKTFVSFGPKLIKAMFTGSVDGLVKEISMALSLATGIASGAMKGDVPEFKPSAGTVAAWEKLSSEVKSIPGSVAKSVGGGASGGGATSPIETTAKDPKTLFDHTPLEKYRDKLRDLTTAFKAGKLTPEQYASGLKQLTKEALSIEGSPIDQFRERLVLLNAALDDHVISSEAWQQQVDEAKQSILGIEPEPIITFAARVETLNAAMKSGLIGPEQWGKSIRKTQQEVLGIQPKPLDEFRDRVAVLNAALAKGTMSGEQWRDELQRAKREILGIEGSPLQQFTDRLKDLREKMAGLTSPEISDGMKKLQQDFLGFDTNPLETYTKKIDELRYALSQKFISPEQFKQAALEALPDKVKQVIDETRTPLQKYKKDLADLEKLKPFLDDKTFAKKKSMLGAELLPSQTFVGYSAAGAVAANRGGAGGSPQDRLLKEAVDARKMREKTHEEQRLARRAFEKLAIGMTMK